MMSDNSTGTEVTEQQTPQQRDPQQQNQQQRDPQGQGQTKLKRYQLFEEVTEVVAILAIAGLVLFAGDVNRTPILVIGSIAIGKRLIRGVGE